MSLSETQCPSCEGRGFVPCDMCEGKGSIFKGWKANPDGSENDLEVWDVCPKCLDDSDWKFPDCPECRGTGKVAASHRVAS